MLSTTHELCWIGTRRLATGAFALLAIAASAGGCHEDASASPVTVGVADAAAIDAPPGDGGATDVCARLSVRLQAALEADLAKQQGAPGAAASVLLPDCTWTGKAGNASEDPKSPMTPQHQFFVGSITKTFAAVAILMLVHDGKLALDDTVGKFVSTFDDAKTTTVRQLLNHTSGLYDYTSSGDFIAALKADLTRVWTPSELLAFAAGKPSTGAGTFHYSATNAILAGMVIESVSGKKFAAEIRSRILGPFKLDATYLAGFEPPAPGALAHAYNGPLDLTQVLESSAVTSSGWTTGSMVSTVADTERFLDALLVKKTMLAAPELAQMETLVPTDALFAARSKAPSYGLGVLVRTTAIGNGVGTGGATAGSQARSFYVADRRASVTLFLNSGTSDVERTFDALVDVLAHPESP